MKVYILTIETEHNGELICSYIKGVYTMVETAKEVATESIKKQKEFWKKSFTFKERSGKGYCNVILHQNENNYFNRYKIEERELA